MNKNKRNLKGMTLYEMIISIAIFAIMCLVLIGIGVHIDNTSKATSNLKNKLVAETHYAGNKIVATDPALEFSKKPVTLKVTCGGKDVEVKGNKYNTETAYTGDKTKNVDETADQETKDNGGLNLEFIVYE